MKLKRLHVYKYDAFLLRSNEFLCGRKQKVAECTLKHQTGACLDVDRSTSAAEAPLACADPFDNVHAFTRAARTESRRHHIITADTTVVPKQFQLDLPS